MTEKILEIVQAGYSIRFRPNHFGDHMDITINNGKYTRCVGINLTNCKAYEMTEEEFLLWTIDRLYEEVRKYG